MRGILISGHTLGETIGVGDFVGELNLTSSNSSSFGRADASIALLSLVRYFEAVVY